MRLEIVNLYSPVASLPTIIASVKRKVILSPVTCGVKNVGGALGGLQEHGPQADAVDGGNAHPVDIGVEIEPHIGRFLMGDGESGLAVEVYPFVQAEATAVTGIASVFHKH